jgi:hypothetical protein
MKRVRLHKLASGLGGPEDKSSHRAGKQHNALKHGAFSTIIILPWEDPEEFRILHAALIAEWNPVGPTEQDAVFTIAKGMWRKRRMQLFLMNDMQRCSTYPDHAAYHEAHALRSFCEVLESSPDKPEDVELAFGLFETVTICDESSHSMIFSPLRNGYARSRMKSHRFCCRRQSVVIV